MAMEIAEIGFDVDGVHYELTPPTVGIAFRVSRKLGGISATLERCKAADLDAMVEVMRIACPISPATEKPWVESDLQALIFSNLEVVGTNLVRYVWSLEHGGRLPVAADYADGGPSTKAQGEGGTTKDGTIEGEGAANPQTPAGGGAG
jgi:hypothetical protein